MPGCGPGERSRVRERGPGRRPRAGGGRGRAAERHDTRGHLPGHEQGAPAGGALRRGRAAPRVRVPGRKRRVRAGRAGRRAHLDRATAGCDPAAGRQALRPAGGTAGRRAAAAGDDRPCLGRRAGGGVRTRARAARRDQGGRRRRRERRRRRPVGRRDPGRLRAGRARVRRRERPGGVLCRALPGPCSAHRGPVPGRLPRRRRGDFHQGLLAAAAPSEDRGGGPGAVPACRPGRAAACGIRGHPAGGGLYGRGDVRVPARPGRRAPLP